ncbi:hypothetical protein IWQ62_002022 [Dispira parvispora]|uniref:Pyridoxal phosphate homeostasis protein n=1 Tax=Dispira parvispora TaxID=1520584 RepID=A0A9W8E8F4_9FUNG|nr:hypothetical protein IWQ62_002022 [Dispira parvispora]
MTASTTVEANLRQTLDNVQRYKQATQARLVAVSKTKPAEAIQEAYAVGQRHFGENYVQELVDKAQCLPEDIRWHYIGQLQSNKCKQLAGIPNLWAVETVDTEKRANSLNAACENRTQPLHVFVQVNTSAETNKGGVQPENCRALVRHIQEHCNHLQLLGLMTIGSVEHSGKVPNPDFLQLRELRDALEKETGTRLELSMGMSHDYQHALEVGSTNVRVGSSIFGTRAKK